MPMPTKGARLFLQKRKGRGSVYIIKDENNFRRSTGTEDRREAEIQLSEHIGQKTRSSGSTLPEAVSIGEVLAIYGEEHAPTVASPRSQGLAIAALLPFWGDKMVSEVKGETCRRYAKTRKHHQTGLPIAPGTIRRELNTLAAAMNYCHSEGYLTNAPRVSLPKAPETFQRALQRNEVAKLIRAARRRKCPHVARFILVSIYTGTRASPVLNLRLRGPATTGGWFDLTAGVLYRMGEGEIATKKRRTPARLPRQLLGHARRWEAGGDIWAVAFRGQRVGSIKTAWAKIVADANLEWRPTPHTLKHTAITWAIEGGASIADASGFFSTSIATIERVYWHRSPHFQSGALGAIENRKQAQTGAKREQDKE
jgi:integrase